MLSESEVRAVLSRLCVKLGFCLPPIAQEQLASAAPADVRGFVDAVFVAEGLDQTFETVAKRGVAKVVRVAILGHAVDEVLCIERGHDRHSRTAFPQVTLLAPVRRADRRQLELRHGRHE